MITHAFSDLVNLFAIQNLKKTTHTPQRNVWGQCPVWRGTAARRRHGSAVLMAWLMAVPTTVLRSAKAVGFPARTCIFSRQTYTYMRARTFSYLLQLERVIPQHEVYHMPTDLRIHIIRCRVRCFQLASETTS